MSFIIKQFDSLYKLNSETNIGVDKELSLHLNKKLFGNCHEKIDAFNTYPVYQV